MYILKLILERSPILGAWSIRHTNLHQFLCLPANQLNPSTPRPTLTQSGYKNTILRNSYNPVYKNILINTKDSIQQKNIYFDIKDSTQHKNHLIQHKRLNSTQKILDQTQKTRFDTNHILFYSNDMIRYKNIFPISDQTRNLPLQRETVSRRSDQQDRTNFKILIHNIQF